MIRYQKDSPEEQDTYYSNWKLMPIAKRNASRYWFQSKEATLIDQWHYEHKLGRDKDYYV